MSDTDVLRKIEIELRDKIGMLESEVTRLRKAIEAAPHTTSCSIWGDMIDTRTGRRPPIECDCWKRNALEGK